MEAPADDADDDAPARRQLGRAANDLIHTGEHHRVERDAVFAGCTTDRASLANGQATVAAVQQVDAGGRSCAGVPDERPYATTAFERFGHAIPFPTFAP